ncbi:NnrU family protein [Phenylobacterium hankyongense]|uniref:NnrU family protein n=1 Tax=Phenylobacterium hankyongense TaxID=1813876 RepID=A0A328B1G4_9CAUL|nr:NnrU family protein [Phenylobacterium hankyongense]RAK61013.1 NnrU family protein [Phenylobacterium hankyongense]
MTSLIAAAAFFVLIHLLVSGTRVRDALTGRIGQGPYMGLFALASVGGLVWLGFAFGSSRGSADNDVLWGMTPATHGLQLALQLVAMLLIVPGLTTPNPTSVRQEGALDRPEVVRGMLRITRHPFLWGVAIWAIGHLLVNGDAASLVLFGSMLVLALFGTASIDAKRKRALGAKWDAFAAQTSNAPFLAIAQGRQRLSLREIGWWRILLAVAVWAALAWAHPYLFGVKAL